MSRPNNDDLPKEACYYVARLQSLQAQELAARVEVDKAHISKLQAQEASPEEAAQVEEIYQGCLQEYRASQKRRADFLDEAQKALNALAWAARA